jgi:hypothetical protein
VLFRKEAAEGVVCLEVANDPSSSVKVDHERAGLACYDRTITVEADRYVAAGARDHAIPDGPDRDRHSSKDPGFSSDDLACAGRRKLLNVLFSSG